MTTVLLGAAFALLVAEDCNGNDVEDALDLRPGTIRFVDPLPGRIGFPSGDPVIVDLDGDGRLDMVVRRFEGVTVSIADGLGDLAAVQEMPIGSGARAMISADVDADGDPDIVTANGLESGEPGNMSVFLNAGGTLGIPRNYAGVRFPASLASGDLDGDMDLDLVTAGGARNGSSDGLAVIKNDGTGRFDLEDTYPAGSEHHSADPAVADLNGDGALDVALARLDSIRVYLGDGKGRLEEAPGIEAPQGLLPSLVVALDADRDGDVDLVSPAWKDGTGGIYGSVVLILNRGRGAFEVPARIGDIASSTDAAAADLDGDGWTDLALSQDPGFPPIHADIPPPGVSVLRGREGGFSPPRTYLLPHYAQGVETGDWDLDGRPDVLSLDLRSGSLFLVQGTILAGADSPPKRHGMSGTFAAVFVDLDQDSDLDLAVSGGESPTLRVFRNAGGDLEPLNPVDSVRMDSLLSADLDGDGASDIAGASHRGLELFFGTGAGAFRPLLAPSPGGLGAPFIADMDGDGDLDVFASSGSEEWYFALLRNAGRGAFEPSALIAPRLEGLQGLPPAPGDFDGDGDTDVLAGLVELTSSSSRGELILMVNPGDGSLEPRRIAGLDQPPLGLAAANLDGDGRTDAVIGVLGCSTCPEGPSRVLVFHGTEAGLREGERHPVLDPGRLQVRDMDGDRDEDAVLSSINDSGQRSFQILRNQGAGSFTVETVSGIGNPGTLIIEDLDGDGVVDVAVAGRARTPCLFFGDVGICSRVAVIQVDVFRGRGGAGFEAPRSFVTLGGTGLLWRPRTTMAAPLRPGAPDLLVLEPSGIALLRNLAEPPASRDRNGDDVPDECQPAFHRGDPSGDGTADLSDAMVVLLHLFVGGAEPACLDAADANDDGKLDIADAVAVLEWLFLGGSPPPPPGPPGEACGPDPRGSTLGCEGHGACGVV